MMAKAQAKATAGVASKVYIPPRRRTARLTVELTDGREVIAMVAKSGVTFKLRRRTGYGQVDQFTMPRDLTDLGRFEDLVKAAIAEASEQADLERADADTLTRGMANDVS